MFLIPKEVIKDALDKRGGLRASTAFKPSCQGAFLEEERMVEGVVTDLGTVGLFFFPLQCMDVKLLTGMCGVFLFCTRAT